MKIGEEVYIHGFIDEIRKDTVIIRNEGGYFGTVKEELRSATEKQTDTATWVELDDYPNEDWECDHCGYIITGIEEPYRFCPNCGKKMWK